MSIIDKPSLTYHPHVQLILARVCNNGTLKETLDNLTSTTGDIMVNVALNWKRIEWMPNETYKKGLLPKLEKVGFKSTDLDRSVYVIRLNGNFCIQYPKESSPTIYIGAGKFINRINYHRKWIQELEELVGDFSFQIQIATPRVQKNPNAYLDCEAALIENFGELYGTAPLWNKKYETRRNDYVYNTTQVKRAIGKGSGAKYKWAIAPMKSSLFYKNFRKTDIDT